MIRTIGALVSVSSCLFLSLTLLAAAEEEPPLFSIGLGIDLASGDYGTDATTTTVSLPLIIDYYPTNRFDLELTIPWVYQSTSYPATALSTTYRSGGGTMFGAFGLGMGGMGGGGSSGTTSTTSTTIISETNSQSGLGDISLRAGFTIISQDMAPLTIRLIGYGKAPTADENKGLGTGAWDGGGGLSLARWFGDLQPYGEGLYVFQGHSSLYPDSRDYFNYEGGVRYQFNDPFSMTVLVRGATSTYVDTPPPLEGRVKVGWRMGSRTSLDLYLATGFSHASPDMGGGLALFVDL